MIDKKDWKNEMLGDVCIIERGGSPRPIEQFMTNDENGINWIKIGDAQEGTMIINSTKEKIKPEGMSKSRFVKKGDFILSNSMSFGKPYILGIDGCIHDGWLVIRDANDVFDKSYLYYFLGCKHTYQTFKKMAVGGVVNNLNSKMVRGLMIPIPPRPIQQQIVYEFDTLNDIISKKKQQLADLDTLAQATFYDMFGDPVSNEKGWEIKKIEDVCLKITDGEHLTPKRESQGIFLLSARNIINHSLKLIDVDFIGQEEFDRISKRIKPKEGDILISCSGSVGRVCRVPANLKFQLVRSVAILQLDVNVSSIFIEYQLCTDFVQDQIKKSINQSSQANLFQGKIKALNIVLPPFSNQSLFSEKIIAIEEQKSLINKSIEDVQHLFDYTMDRYFN